MLKGFPDGSVGKETVHNAGDPGLIPELERSPGEGNGNPLQYSFLGKPMEGSLQTGCGEVGLRADPHPQLLVRSQRLLQAMWKHPRPEAFEVLEAETGKGPFGKDGWFF